MNDKFAFRAVRYIATLDIIKRANERRGYFDVPQDTEIYFQRVRGKLAKRRLPQKDRSGVG